MFADKRGEVTPELSAVNLGTSDGCPGAGGNEQRAKLIYLRLIINLLATNKDHLRADLVEVC